MRGGTVGWAASAVAGCAVDRAAVVLLLELVRFSDIVVASEISVVEDTKIL